MNRISKLIIEGGQPLEGEVTVSGAKNAATKMMVASLLTDEPVVLYNTPEIGDIDITREICEEIGSTVDFKNHELSIHTPKIKNTKVKQQSFKNRLSVLAIAPLLHRACVAELPIVGGDNIGARPVNYHIMALRQMGVEVTESADGYKATAKAIHGSQINLPYPSVGATENVILAAVLAKGRTIIRGAALEPELTELVMMLQRMGAIIEYRANRVIIIDGVDRLHGTSFRVIPDRLEAASYGILAIATNGKILVKDAQQENLITFLNTLRRMGAEYSINQEGITFSRGGESLKSVVVKTDVWPGFSSDWQQPLAVALTQTKGKSIIHETVYANRFEYIKTLNQMGANISLFDARKLGLSDELAGTHYNQSAQIVGPTPLSAANIEIPDIRAGMAYVIAALTASGKSEITGIDQLLRGYDDPLNKLHAIGAQFKIA